MVREVLLCDFILGNEPHGGPEAEVNNAELKAVIELDVSHTMRELAATFYVAVPTILNHFKKIGKKKKLDRWIPHELNERLKRGRL